ncbi:unnamed protein product, partial [Ectocarpus fasciculatus]
FPQSNAVLVQRHGCYVWGPTWQKAKTQTECPHYLLEASVKMDAVGFDPAEPPRDRCSITLTGRLSRVRRGDDIIDWAAGRPQQQQQRDKHQQRQR